MILITGCPSYRQPLDFYRATRTRSADYAAASCFSVFVFVCHTRRYSVETVYHQSFSPPSSSFHTEWYGNILTETLLTAASNATFVSYLQGRIKLLYNKNN